MTRLPRVRVVLRFRAASGRLSRFVTGSLAVHGLFVAAILVAPLTHRRVAPIDDAMVVSLAGPLPRAASKAAAPAVAAPPPAAPAPPPKEAHVAKDVPVPKAKPPDKPPKKKEPAPPETPPPPPAAPGAGDDSKPGPPAGPAAPAGAPTGVTAVVGGGDAALGWYGAAVKAALESAWIKPFLEDATETFSVTVAFAIARDGTVRDVRIVQPSGVPSLDRSALRAVAEASPLPAIPSAWPDDVLPATMRFDLTPESR